MISGMRVLTFTSASLQPFLPRFTAHSGQGSSSLNDFEFANHFLAFVVSPSTCLPAGVSLSLLSRIMSPRLSRGTFNCGLLSTEAGTFARVVGDGLITLTGYLGTSYVLNLTMLPVLLSVLIALGLFRGYYSAMY